MVSVRTKPVAVPAWLPIVSLALAVAGLLVAGYLTIEHFTASTTLACPETGVVNCTKVTTSEQSKVLGIPVAVLGLVFFVPMVIACLPRLWRDQRPAVRYGRLGLAGLGVVFVFYLVYAELFVIDAICLWCTAVHLCALALLVAVLWASGASPARR